MEKDQKLLSTGMAYLAMGLIVIFLVFGMIGLGVNLAAMLLFAWLIVVPFAYSIDIPFSQLQESAFEMIKRGMEACVILFAVGALTGAWIASGTVPGIIYVGLKIMSPKIFLVSSMILCSIVSLATGTSWGTIATAGIAMMGIGAGLGIPAGMTAGSVICGAFFGDKISPLSDTTIMSSALAGANVFVHIKHMMYTALPSYLVTMVIFLVFGFKYGGGNTDMSNVNAVLDSINSVFKVGFVVFIPAIVVLVLLVSQRPSITSIMIGAVVGVVIAVLYQGIDIKFAASTLYEGYSGEFGDEFLNKLLNRGGMTSMFNLVTIMIAGLGLGGMLREAGVLPAIIKSIATKINSTGSLTLATMATSYITLGIGGSMAFCHVMTATIMEPLYVERRLKPENLSRSMEDAGTMGAPLIPWGASSLYCVEMLQTPYLTFVPYCFLSFFHPIVGAIYGFTGFSMFKYSDEEWEELKRERALAGTPIVERT